MTNVQKTIKYLAMALAIFLAVSIISAIFFGISSIGMIFGYHDKDNVGDMLQLSNVEDANILDIEVKSVNLVIKEGMELKAETDNKYIDCTFKDNKLYIKEKSHTFKFDSEMGDLILYVPSDMVFDEVSIENGAGKIEIEQISARVIDLDLGAGKVNIHEMVSLAEASIEGGAGEINIDNANINNLEIDMGIGKLTLTAYLKGNSEINAGVGEINLNLIGSEEDYLINLDKGIGLATYNDNEMKNNTTYGNGNNKIMIDGGIGSIKIRTIGEDR